MRENNKFDGWRGAWKNYLLGEKWDETTTDAVAIIASLERIVDDKSGIKSSSAYSSIFDLRALAMAYKTKGTKYYQFDEIKEQIIAGLMQAYEKEYNCNILLDDWWLLQIGNPLRLLDVLILMYDELPNRDEWVTKLTDVILHFQNAYEITSRGQKETGANLIWKCHVLLLTGILRKDMNLIDWVNEELPTVLQYSGMKEIHGQKFYDDGFHPDGSFIQHYFFAYTGGYGKNLLIILSGLLYAFDGEACLTLSDEKWQFFFDMIPKVYEPLIYNGRFMDLARGREISRYFHQDNMTGRHIIRGLCYLSSTMTGETQTRTRAMIKEWFRHNDNRVMLLCDESPRAEYFVSPSILDVLNEIDQDTTLPRGELIGNYQFNIMSKVVHLTKKFGFAISMHSPTIAGYETVAHEGARTWHISDGMTYLYTTDATQYNNDYFGCVDMQRLPGITVDRSPHRYSDPYFTWYLPESKNPYSFAGGATLGEFGVTGLQYRGQGNGKERDLEVKKSWFMFDEEVVCLGSGITSTTGNQVETVIDNKRLLTDMSNQITVNDGKTQNCIEVLGEKIVKAASTLHITGNNDTDSDVGYYFPNGEQINVLCEKRTGEWMNLYDDTERQCQNGFATIWIDHGEKVKNSAYSYVILPGKSVSQTTEYSRNPNIEIASCSDSAHAIKNTRLNMIGVNFWKQEKFICEGITCDNQASVMILKNDDNIKIAVSDPTKTDAEINMSFDFAVTNIKEKAEQIEIISLQPLTVKVDTKNLHGSSVNLCVEVKEWNV